MESRTVAQLPTPPAEVDPLQEKRDTFNRKVAEFTEYENQQRAIFDQREQNLADREEQFRQREELHQKLEGNFATRLATLVEGEKLIEAFEKAQNNPAAPTDAGRAS